MTKEQSVLESILLKWDGWRRYIADGGRASWPRDEFEQLIENYEAKIAEQQKLIDHWMIMTNTYADNLELHKAKIAELEARIAEQQKELDSAKNQEPGAWRIKGTENPDMFFFEDDIGSDFALSHGYEPLYSKPFSTKELDDCKDAVVMLHEAMDDMLSGWKYIRSTHGDLYGVGWDRAERKSINALSAASAIVTKIKIKNG